MSLHSVSLTHKRFFFFVICKEQLAYAPAVGPSPPGINWTESARFWKVGNRSYHADIVSVEQELGELDLGTGIVTKSPVNRRTLQRKPLRLVSPRL